MSDYDPFAAHYDDWASEMTQDIAWYVELARQAEGPVVELAVGTGRIAIPIARETGKRVIGIDRSPAMLAVGRERAGGLPVEFRRGDMRELALDEPVDLIICPYRSMMHMPTWSDRRAVFEAVSASLRPGGRFAWNTFVLSPFLVARFDGKRQVISEDLWEEMTYALGDGRLDITRGRGADTHGSLSLWCVTRGEWDGLIEVAGLETEALYGGFAREDFEDDSDEFVWVARKPAP